MGPRVPPRARYRLLSGRGFPVTNYTAAYTVVQQQQQQQQPYATRGVVCRALTRSRREKSLSVFFFLKRFLAIHPNISVRDGSCSVTSRFFSSFFVFYFSLTGFACPSKEVCVAGGRGLEKGGWMQCLVVPSFESQSRQTLLEKK